MKPGGRTDSLEPAVRIQEKDENPKKQVALVVDPAPNDLSFLERVLEGEGFRVLTAPQGAAGLNMMERENPDLVLADVRTPLVSGYTLSRYMRRLRGDVTFLLTAGSGDGEGTEWEANGADGLLIKPLDKSRVLAALKKARFRPVPQERKERGGRP